MFNRTVSLLSQCLGKDMLLQQVISTNIANANTPGFKTLELSQAPVPSEDTLVVTTNNRPVALDEQVTLAVKNATEFRALIKGINYEFSIMKIALQGN